MRDYRPGDLVQVCYGTHDGPRDVSCMHCTVFSVVNEGSQNVGLAMYDRGNRVVLASAKDVVFIRHEAVTA